MWSSLRLARQVLLASVRDVRVTAELLRQTSPLRAAARFDASPLYINHSEPILSRNYGEDRARRCPTLRGRRETIVAQVLVLGRQLAKRSICDVGSSSSFRSL